MYLQTVPRQLTHVKCSDQEIVAFQLKKPFKNRCLNQNEMRALSEKLRPGRDSNGIIGSSAARLAMSSQRQ